MTYLEEITRKLGKTYKLWKDKSLEKDKLRDQFFYAATRQFSDPEIKYEWIVANTVEEMHQEIIKRFPEYIFVEIKKHGKGQFLVELEENLNFRPFIYVNQSDKQVYQKSRTNGAPMLDEETLKAADPDLWMQITRVPKERELIPLEELPSDIIARVQKYIYMGPPQMRLLAPRKAKADELEV